MTVMDSSPLKPCPQIEHFFLSCFDYGVLLLHEKSNRDMGLCVTSHTLQEVSLVRVEGIAHLQALLCPFIRTVVAGFR